MNVKVNETTKNGIKAKICSEHYNLKSKSRIFNCKTKKMSSTYLNTMEEFNNAVSATRDGNPMVINFSSAMVRDSLRYDNIFVG